jgi:hypothetical protein
MRNQLKSNHNNSCSVQLPAPIGASNPIGANDARDIISVAEVSPGFSIPSEYTIWMLALSQDGLCRIVRGEMGQVLGYILAIKGIRANELFFWQLGLAKQSVKSKVQVATALIHDHVTIAYQAGIRVMYFTARPRSLKHINRYLDSAGCSSAEVVKSLCGSGWRVPTRGEVLYVTNINGK